MPSSRISIISGYLQYLLPCTWPKQILKPFRLQHIPSTSIFASSSSARPHETRENECRAGRALARTSLTPSAAWASRSSRSKVRLWRTMKDGKTKPDSVEDPGFRRGPFLPRPGVHPDVEDRRGPQRTRRKPASNDLDDASPPADSPVHRINRW